MQLDIVWTGIVGGLIGWLLDRLGHLPRSAPDL